jgi:hypothetical protein
MGTGVAQRADWLESRGRRQRQIAQDAGKDLGLRSGTVVITATQIHPLFISARNGNDVNVSKFLAYLSTIVHSSAKETMLLQNRILFVISPKKMAFSTASITEASKMHSLQFENLSCTVHQATLNVSTGPPMCYVSYS